MIERQALFADGTEPFCSPMEADPGEKVTIRFRCAIGNLEQVWLCTPQEEREMGFAYSAAGLDYYETTIELGRDVLTYGFRVRQGQEVLYFTRGGVSEEADPLFFFRLAPGFHTPDWAKGAVLYQIYPDRFCNGDPSNDVLSGEYAYLGRPVRRNTEWETLPDARIDVGNFHGGDLQGILDKLDYLQDLGVEALYLNPIFVSPSNHKYDAQDYDAVDPHLGKIVEDKGDLLQEGERDNARASRYRDRVTSPKNLEASNKLFCKLVAEAHARGMRVILDGVFNHCGSFHKWMDHERIYEGRPGYAKGAYLAENSPYHDFFSFRKGGSWPCNEQYAGWWDHRTLPKLNYEGSHRLQEEILRIARKWVSAPFHADGWRLDVAADLGHSEEFNHRFWKRFREEVKKANPEALILAEHYGDPTAWLSGDQWDSVMNYDAFMEPVTWFLTGMEKHSEFYSEERHGNAEFFAEIMRTCSAAFPTPALLTAMNELDNHDHSRFLTRTNGLLGRVTEHGSEAAEEDVRKDILREAVVMQMTWPGAPTVYYGDEAGLCGFTDPDSRRSYPWGNEDKELQAFYRDAIALHKTHPALRTGALMMLLQGEHLLGYARFDADEILIVLVNNRDEEVQVETDVWPAGIPRDWQDVMLRQIFSTTESGYTAEAYDVWIHHGHLSYRMAPRSAVVLQVGTKQF